MRNCVIVNYVAFCEKVMAWREEQAKREEEANERRTCDRHDARQAVNVSGVSKVAQCQGAGKGKVFR